MNLRFFLPILMLTIFASCGNEENKKVAVTKPDAVIKPKGKPQKAGLRQSYELIKPRKNQYNDATVRIGDSMVYCSYKGKIAFGDTLGNSRISIVDLRCEYFIDRVHVLPVQPKQWMIVWQETYQLGQRTNIARFREGEQAPVWKLTFPNTNAGPVALDQNMCYFTMMGMVGKLNIDNGELQWKVDSLFNQYKMMYKKFEVPKVYENKVVFVDFPERGRREIRDTLVLDPATGARKK